MLAATPRSTLTVLALLGLGCVPASSTSEDSSTTDGPETGTGAETESESETGTETESETGTETETGDEPGGCWTDLGFGEVETFYAGFSGSEGIAFGADGRLYVTTNEDGDGTIWQLDADANLSEFAKVPYALGPRREPEGGLVVASIGVTDASVNDGAVYVVDADGGAQLLASGIASPNFIALAPDGSALVSDDFDNTRVFRVTTDGQVSVVLEQVESPNGMAYSPDGAHFYVASTFTPLGQLTRYDVDAQGLPIEATAVEILHLGQASTPDGIAVDVDGMVYVAANIPGQIWRVDGAADSLQRGELVAEDILSVASMAFGDGPGFDPCSLYVTQLFGNKVLRGAIGTPGAL